MEMDEYLAHYGVKGMRWGRRKGNPSEDHKKVAAIRKKKVSEMSNAELREALNRMKMQNEYNQNSKQLRDAGRSKTKNALKNFCSKFSILDKTRKNSTFIFYNIRELKTFL